LELHHHFSAQQMFQSSDISLTTFYLQHTSTITLNILKSSNVLHKNKKVDLIAFLVLTILFTE